MIAGCEGRVRAAPQARSDARAGLWTIVLAAGGARRFGSHKLLVHVGGTTLLRRSVDMAGQLTGHRCIVVLGAGHSRLATRLRGSAARIVVNRRWREGMSTSLSVGVAALPRSARAALIVLADQFAVSRRDLETLIAAWSRHPRRATAAGIGGEPVAPAVLPRHMFRELLSLEGDRGARALLRRPGMFIAVVPLPSAGRDLDQRRDLAALQRHRSPGRR